MPKMPTGVMPSYAVEPRCIRPRGHRTRGVDARRVYTVTVDVQDAELLAIKSERDRIKGRFKLVPRNVKGVDLGGPEEATAFTEKDGISFPKYRLKLMT